MSTLVTDHIDRDLAIVRAWQIRGGLPEVAAAVLRLWDGQAWGMRGYESWTAMFAAEVGEPLRLNRSNRVHLHELLRSGGMSTRAVAVVTGVDQSSVVRTNAKTDAPRISLESAPSPEPEPPVTTGLDGARRVTDPVASAALTRDILALRAAGHTWDEVAEATGITASAASQRYRHHRKQHPDATPDPPVQLPTPVRIAELAATGVTSVQIATELGISQERVRALARRDGIRLVGDINRGKGGAKTVDMSMAITNWITHLIAALDSADTFIDLDDMDADEAAQWAHQLNEISSRFRALTRRFNNRSTSGRQAHHG